MVSGGNEFLPRVVAVGGIRGVGKTSTLTYISLNNPRMKIILLSQELKDYCLKETGKFFFDHDIPTRDAVREAYGIALARRLANAGEDVTFLDLHFSDYQEGERKVIQPRVVLERVSVLTLLDASDETILKRRQESEDRARPLSVAAIRQERESEVWTARVISQEFQLPLVEVSSEKKHEEVARELLRSLNLEREEGNFQGKERGF